MITVYGIVNCSTVQKARSWLTANSIDYEFYDYKKLGIDKEHLKTWCNQFGWEKVLNRSGMMWRKASEEDKQKVVDTNSAIEFMLKVPTAIKRPIIELENDFLIGFDAKEYQEKLIK
jgi:Spx/MgsR family transcriptional regulator